MSTNYPDGSGLEDVTYTYDTWGNLLTVSHDGKLVCEYTYDGLGQLLSMKEHKNPETTSSGYVLRTYDYDSLGRCTSIRYLDNGSEDSLLESFAYTYDKNSQILTCRHINNLPAEDKRIDETRSYTYDSYGQLTESVITDHRNSDAQSVTTYTYEKVGNRTAMTRDGQTTAYTYNGLNQLVEADTPDAIINYTYDGRGNQITEYNGTKETTTAYTYAVTGEMTGMTVSSGDITTFTQENQYNHEGIRISKTESGVTRRYYYDNGIVAYTKDGATVSSANVLSGDGDILGSYRGEDYHVYTKDVQNSAESIIKEDGSLAAAYRYTDFGETEELTGSSFDNEICYTGAVYDAESGLYYMNARYYDPANGRFISQDTYRGEMDNPGQWHLYAYCANNPINYVDPSGHSSWSLMFGIISEVLFWATQIASTPIRQKAKTVISIAQAGVTLYDYAVAERQTRKCYGSGTKKYRNVMKFNNFMLGVSAVSITMDFFLWRLGKRIKERIIYKSVQAFYDFGIARSISWFGITYDAAYMIYTWDRARYKTKYSR